MLSKFMLKYKCNLELIVHCHNLNPSKSQQLKSSCKPLADYSDFSYKFKEYRSQNNSTNDSVRMAIDYCLKNDILTDYLTDNESEVINMFGFEWNSEDERKALIELGEERGTINANLKTLKNIMSAQNWPPEKALTFMGIEKSEYQNYLALL